MIRAVVFDFDGLILDSEGPVYQAWAEVYERFGEELSLDFWRTIIGRGAGFFDPLADLEKRLGRPLEREAIRAEKRLRERELVEAQPVLPGVHEWREEAAGAGLKLGVASSSSRSWVLGHLDRLGLDGWDCVRCADDVARPKPDPDVYLAALDCLGTAASGALAVEDSTHGIAAAKAAGLFCVAVPGPLTMESDLSAADLRLASLDERRLAEVIPLAERFYSGRQAPLDPTGSLHERAGA